MAAMKNLIFFSWSSNNLTNYGRKLKLFINSHVSWDTLYVKSEIRFATICLYIEVRVWRMGVYEPLLWC